jgi:uncharacterized protein
MVEPSNREADGEARFKAVGLVKGLIITLVFTYRETKIRVISARRSNPPEERKYGNR